MLGALSLKWKWRQRREADGKPTDSPNLVFGGDVNVVWEKFCSDIEDIGKFRIVGGRAKTAPRGVQPRR